jgi:hypothetical protein
VGDILGMSGVADRARRIWSPVSCGQNIRLEVA